MLQQILGLIHAGQVGTSRQLAEHLQVSEALVRQMIDQLVANGYLEEARMCGDGCGGCAMQVACGPDRDPRLWSLTGKGRRAAMG